jgi:hypothetical protein
MDPNTTPKPPEQVQFRRLVVFTSLAPRPKTA